MSYQDALARIIEDVIAPGAAEVDAGAIFPRRQVGALAEAELLAITVPTDIGGGGLGLRAASYVVTEIGAVCASTAMVVTMHYAATAALVAGGIEGALAEITAGQHLSTLAFSEVGSRSHFWAPLGTATADGDDVRLDGRKSWVTAAGEADSYVWSSLPVDAEGPMTLWSVPGGADGLTVAGKFDGLGLRGNASSPMTAEGVRVPRGAMIGEDGAGLDLALAAVLPVFLICSASMSAGLMRRLADETAAHLQQTYLQHLGQSLAQQVQPRAQLARLRIEADRTRSLIDDTLTAVEQDRADAQLQVLEVKAAAGEAAAEAADLALRAGGGAAFRKESVVERLFRDSRAARVMAPTTDALHDFIGRALCGLPLLGDAA
jgi:isovaleryl-CoA dehydrogenase